MYETKDSRDSHLEIIRSMVEGSGDTFTPLLVCDLDGVDTAVAVVFENDTDKDSFQKFLFGLVAHSRITGFSLTTESWQTKLPKNSKLSLNELMALNPLDRPHTTECMMIVFSHGGEELSYIADLETVDGKRVLGDWKEVPQSGLSGRFTHIWKMSKAVCN